MLYYKVILLAGLKVLKSYSKIADMFKLKAVALLLKPLYTLKLNPTIKSLSFLWLQLRRSLLLTAFHAYLRFVYNSLRIY